MPSAPKKIEKTCANCVIPDKLPTYCRQPGTPCARWIFKRACCHFCTNLKACFELGRVLARDHVCINFKKKKTPWNDAIWSFIAASLESDSEGPILTPKGFKKSTPDEQDEPGGDNFNPVELVENIINSDFDPRAMALVDDRDIPRATNPLIFLTDKKFMGVDLFPRQLQTFAEFWSCYCPWCSNTEWLRNSIEVDTPRGEIWDRMVLYKNGLCPKCKRNKADAVDAGLSNFYNTLVMVCGQRSGKSVSTGMVAAVHTYQYLTMSDIHTTFGLLPATVLHGTFVGLRWSDAHDNLWEPYYDLITNTPWFKDYLEFMKVEGNRLGVELVNIKTESIAWKYKRMAWYPSGPDRRKLRGRTRIFAAGDEVGWFFGSEGGIKYNFDEIHKALSNSLMTIRPESKRLLAEIPDIPNAIDCYISSPSSKLDPIMRMYKQSKGSKDTLGLRWPTWEFNPRIKKSDLNEHYRKDPIAAERDFGANPPFSTDPYIRSPASLVAAIQTQKNCIVTKGIVTSKDSLGGSVQYNKIHIQSHSDIPACLSIDTGYSGNSFALTVNHWLKTEEGNKLFTPALVELIPYPNPIDFPGVYKNIIVPIIQTFNIKLVTFDRWQSINLQQTIFQDHGIDCLQYSVTYKDFDAIRQRIYAGEYLVPATESPIEELLELDKNLDVLIDRKPVNHFILQLLSSKDTGRTVTKGEETTDDILRSTVLGLCVMLMPEHEALFTGEGRTNRRWTDKVLGSGLARSLSIGSSGFNTTISGVASGGSSNILRHKG